MYLHQKNGVAKDRVGRLLRLSFSTIDYKARSRSDAPIGGKLSALAEEPNRFGHPRLFVLLPRDFAEVNHKRSRRIYRSLGLQIGRRKRK